MNINEIIREVYEGENSYDQIKLSDYTYGQQAQEIRAMVNSRIRMMKEEWG